MQPEMRLSFFEFSSRMKASLKFMNEPAADSDGNGRK